MKLYATCLVRNEDDIVEQCLRHAAQYCDHVVVVDNSSSDQTWEIVQSLAKTVPQITPLKSIEGTFRNQLRGIAYNHFHTMLTNDDWWMVLDADEFLAEDPRPAIAAAVQQGADIIRAWFQQYYYTELDLQQWKSGEDQRSRPIMERRHHYLVNWQEYRFFRNRTDLEWEQTSSGGAYFPAGLKKVASRRVLIKHYQYRDPPQIYKRIETRLANNPFFAKWRMPQKSKARGFQIEDIMRDSKSLQMDLSKPKWHLTAYGILYYHVRNTYTRLRRNTVRLVSRVIRLFQ